MDPFALFTSTSYTFLQLDQLAEGNVVIDETTAEGIFKLRDGMTALDNIEFNTSDATLHIRPDEAFIATVSGDLVGHGVRVGIAGSSALEYRIEGSKEGRDYDTGQLKFFLLNLKRTDIATWEESDLLQG